MMKRILAVLCVVVLAAALFAGCAKNDIKTDGTSTDAGAVSGAGADQASSAASAGDVGFPIGGWEDSVVRFEFNTDGQGYIMYKSDYDGNSLTYEAVPGSNSITVHFGAADNSEEVAYETPDENTLILKFEDGQTYTLVSADVFSFPVSGTWENDEVSYAFNEDYSGTITGKEDGTGVGFEYDVYSTNYVFLLMGSSDNAEIVKYEMPDENTLHLTYKDGTDLTLRRTE